MTNPFSTLAGAVDSQGSTALSMDPKAAGLVGA